MEFYHSHIVISNFPSAFSHHHFIILFYLPHFIIRILSSLFFHPPSAAIRSAFNRDPLTGVFSLSQEINFWCIYHQLTLWYVDFPRTQMNNIPEKKSCYALIEPMLGTYLLLTSFSRSELRTEFFPLGFMARALPAWAINRCAKKRAQWVSA